jgi:hypothetical protein
MKGRAMPQYRLYFLDADGQLKRPVELDCHDDNEALEHANKYQIGDGMDLWCGPRRVKVFKPPS